MQKLLFVCLGNICRSPTAEAIFDSLIEGNKLEGQLSCDSAGTSDYHIGERPDPRSLQYGEARGYHFKSRARQFHPPQDFENFTWIICMDDSNFRNICRLSDEKSHLKKVKRMSDFFPDSSPYTQVPDPYYEGADGFDLVLNLLEEACENLLQEVKKAYF